jgi:hypothetical protein
MGPTLLVERVECSTKTLARVFDADALRFARDELNPKRISEGGGVRKIRNAIGNSSCFRVWGLNSMRSSPAARKGRVSMWYSIGVNV